ncbi:glycosyltransferase family 2 protein [Rhodoferax sp.]|uniref:glycosyltransferase family 2 protein n=1 Tax=Rhodoferax sp. TaxID=50421 RepID=UPI00374DCD17
MQSSRTIISILNWNTADSTVACVSAVLATLSNDLNVKIIVLDNGSAAADWASLQAQMPQDPRIEVLREEQNLGFAGGHNVVARIALRNEVDFIWLLNSDATVTPDVLQKLLRTLHGEPRCGAVSPVIYATHDHAIVDFCGAMHDWDALESTRTSKPEEARALEARFPTEMWLHGTAPLYRMRALAEVGLLDEGFFAYYEDDDLGVRLSRAGWLNQMCFDAVIFHPRRTAIHAERPPYYFYLMARNGVIFWDRHTLKPYRKRMLIRLLSRSLLEAAKLQEKGFDDKSDACLNGFIDGVKKRTGPPKLHHTPPRWLKFLSKIIPYRAHMLLS